MVIYNILTVAMPKNQKIDYSSRNPNLSMVSSSERYARAMANLVFNKKKSDRQQVILKGSGLPQS
jgi:flagellar assembly factor FliW